MNNEEQKILDITVKYSDAVDGIAKYRESINELEKAEKRLKQEFRDGNITKKEYQRQMTANKEAVKDYKDSIRVLSKEVQNNLRREKEQEGSLRSLRAQLSNATKAYDELSRAERNGARGREMQEHINAITRELKEAEEGTQRFYRNVGNYKGSILEAVAGNNQFAKSLLAIGGNGAAGGVAGGAAMGAAGLAAAGIGLLVAGIVKLKEVMSEGTSLIIDFEKANSNLAAVLGETPDKIKVLTDDALRLGEATRYTATEVTMLQTELAKLGFSKQEILDSTEDVLMFANATGSDLGSAASVAGAALRAFGDDAKNMGRYVSAMAVGTTKSALSFGDLSTTISTLAPVAHAFGFEIEDVVTLMGKLRDSGFDASSAATATRNILLNLANANGDLARSLGGPVRDMESLQKGLIGLRDSGIDLATALELTDKRSVAAFESFMSSADGLVKMREAVTDCEDGLKQMNDTMSDNVQGSLAKLESAWQGLLLKFYNSRGAMKVVVDGLTKIVTWCSNLGNKFTEIYDKSLLVRASWNGFVGVLKVTFKWFSDVVGAMLVGLKGLAKVLEGLLTLDVSRMWSGIKDVVTAAPKALFEMGKDAGQVIVDGLKKTLKKEKPKVEVEVEMKEPDDIPGDGAGGDKKPTFKKKMSDKEKKAAEAAERLRAEQNKKEQEELQKGENLLLQIVEQGSEVRRKAIEKEYDQKIDVIRRRLNDEKNLTVKAREAMMSQEESLKALKEKKLAEFDVKAKNEQIARETKAIEMILETVKKGSDQEYQLKLSKIDNQKKVELNSLSLAVMSEEEKNRQVWAINEKYNHLIEEADKEHQNVLLQQQREAIENRYKEQILKAETSDDEMREVEALRLELEMKQELRDSAQQMEAP